MLLLGGNKANQTFCHGQILPQGLPNICLNNSPQELKILIDFKMLARRDGEVGVAGKGGNYRRGANVYLPAAKPPQPLPSPGTGERGPGCAPPGEPPPPAAPPPAAPRPPRRRHPAPGHLGPGCSASGHGGRAAVAGVGSSGRGGDPGPGASAPFREEF